jgi:hypothetical protein
MHIPFVINVSGVNLDDHAADISRFGIPGYVITNFEFFGHECYLDLSTSGSGTHIKRCISECVKLRAGCYARITRTR